MPAWALRPVASIELPPGDLVGRIAEVAKVQRRLEGNRLVTVTGLPGAGKTAVSLEAAAASAVNFAHGAVLVRLDALAEENLLPESILAAVRSPGRYTSSPLRALIGELQDRHMLLVLDNCEHMLGACAAVTAALLLPCVNVRVLATSREPLRVPGEATVCVPPLLLDDAVELFSWRAAGSGLRVTAENRAAVAALCVQLDRLPLAVELAAGQTAAGELADLLSAVEAADYEALRDPGRPVSRHRSLRAAIGWSHELCTPAERLLWARLSVFTGPFRRQDAQDVCTTGHLSDEAVAAGLTLLTERSILLCGAQADGGVRFLLPNTLRAFGRQMLGRLAEEAEFDDRYQRWCRRQGPVPHS
jgi:predicted ATPase